jgi:predicted transcriptional regulator
LTPLIDINIDNDKFLKCATGWMSEMAYFSARSTSVRSPKAGAAFNALKRDIMLGTLAPGTGLTELELAAHFQCSQGTVREALLQLQEEGLVRRRGIVERRFPNARKTKQSRCSGCVSR